jgi:hypothetical protein
MRSCAPGPQVAVSYFLNHIFCILDLSYLLHDSHADLFCLEIAATQHTTTCFSMQVIDITPMKHHFTSITPLRVVQQKHMRVDT